jgi:hypothetical protein
LGAVLNQLVHTQLRFLEQLFVLSERARMSSD